MTLVASYKQQAISLRQIVARYYVTRYRLQAASDKQQACDTLAIDFNND
jgi:hypothetical protein